MKTLALTLAACMLGLVQSASAQGFGNSVGVAARIGTMGMGIEFVTPITPMINVRAGLNRFSYSRSDVREDDELDVQLDSDLRLSSMMALLDFHPMGGGFRLTSGLYFNFNELDFFAVPMGPYELNGRMRSPSEIGSMNAKLGHQSKLNPYAGIGLGNAVGSRIGFVLDLGVLYTDSPRIEMSGTGMIAPTANQAPGIEEDVRGLKIFPLLSIGLSYRLY